jgi:hypothetical protein
VRALDPTKLSTISPSETEGLTVSMTSIKQVWHAPEPGY